MMICPTLWHRNCFPELFSLLGAKEVVEVLPSIPRDAICARAVAHFQEQVSFAHGGPFLLCGSSLDLL